MSLVSETNVQPMIWDTDPSETDTDCMIVVTNTGNNSKQTYHVHSSVLGSQTHKSDFFHEQLLKAEKGSIHIELSDSAAVAFPEVLDYIYTGMWSLNRGNLSALYFLADFLVLRELQEEVGHRMSRLSPEAVYRNLFDAYFLRSEALFDRIVDLLKMSNVSLFHDITPSYLFSLTPNAFIIIFKLIFNVTHGFVASSEDLSVALTAFLEARPEITKDPQLLASLTDSHLIPTVSPLAALFFLRMTSTHKLANQVEVDSLEQRCLIACERWQEYSGAEVLFSVTTDDCCEDEMLVAQHDDPLLHDFSCLSESVKVKVLRSVLKGSLSPKPKAKSLTEFLFPSLATIWEFPSRHSKPISKAA